MIDSYLRNQTSPMSTLPITSQENSNLSKKHLYNDDSKQTSSFQDNIKRKVNNKQRPASANSAGRLKGFTFRDFQDKNKFIKDEVIVSYS